MFSDTSSQEHEDGHTATDYDGLFKNDALNMYSDEEGAGGGGGGEHGGGGDFDGGGMPREESRGPQVRYDPTLTAVQAYAEREYGYDTQRSGSVSAFDPDMMSRVEVAVDRDEMLDVVHAAHNRRRCVFCTFLVVVVGSVVIGSSVGFAKKNAGGGGGGSQTVSSVLVAPPQALEQMCSIRNIAREEGHDECEAACLAAACCMAAGTKSCFLEQEGICGMYSPCGVLHSQTEGGGEYSSYSSPGGGSGGSPGDDIIVPPPPTDLEAQCSDASLSTINGYIACQSACHPGKCCYAADPAVPFHGSSGTSSYAVESCVQSHRDVCLGYAPCLALGGTGHENPQQTVQHKCAPDKVKTREGRDACDDLCKARSCCFASSEKRNCRIDNKKWCAEYQACEILLDKPSLEPHKGEFGDVDSIDNSDPAALAEMADQCQQSRIVTHNDLLKCEDACRPALCCFYDDVECEESFEMRRCNDYLFCKPVVSKMFDFGGVDLEDADLGLPQGEGGVTAGEEEATITAAPQNSAAAQATGGNGGGNFEPSDALGSAVAEACDPSNLLDASGRDDCRVLCEPYLCCSDPGPQGCSSNRECPRYDKCANLVEADAVYGAGIVPPDAGAVSSLESSLIEGGGDEGNGAGAGAGAVVDPNTNDLSLACSEDYLEDAPGRCESLCGPMTCCFDYRSDSGCYLNPDCSRYAPCSVLAEDAGDGGVDSAAEIMMSVESACDPNTISDAKKEQACYALCVSHRCCFDGTCPQMGNICREYEACDIIFNGSGNDNDNGDFDDSVGMPEPPADIKKVCNPWKIDEDDNRESCLDDCQMGNCCRGVGGDCRDMTRFCDEFILCQTVWDDDGSDAYKKDLAAGIGGGGGGGTAGKRPPKTEAQTFATTETPGQEPKEPEPAASGGAVAAAGNGNGDPNVLCSIENLERPGGREACDDACRPWRCCWGDKNSNCFDENTTTCLRYLSCPTNSGD